MWEAAYVVSPDVSQTCLGVDRDQGLLVEENKPDPGAWNLILNVEGDDGLENRSEWPLAGVGLHVMEETKHAPKREVWWQLILKGVLKVPANLTFVLLNFFGRESSSFVTSILQWRLDKLERDWPEFHSVIQRATPGLIA
jgi:hypothetical protein